jgi:hypothetical protein
VPPVPTCQRQRLLWQPSMLTSQCTRSFCRSGVSASMLEALAGALQLGALHAQRGSFIASVLGVGEVIDLHLVESCRICVSVTWRQLHGRGASCRWCGVQPSDAECVIGVAGLLFSPALGEDARAREREDLVVGSETWRGGSQCRMEV